MTILGFPWELVALVCIIVLGAAIAYGLMHNRGRTAAQRAASERGAHQLYEREDMPP